MNHTKPEESSIRAAFVSMEGMMHLFPRRIAEPSEQYKLGPGGAAAMSPRAHTICVPTAFPTSITAQRITPSRLHAFHCRANAERVTESPIPPNIRGVLP